MPRREAWGGHDYTVPSNAGSEDNDKVEMETEADEVKSGENEIVASHNYTSPKKTSVTRPRHRGYGGKGILIIWYVFKTSLVVL